MSRDKLTYTLFCSLVPGNKRNDRSFTGMNETKRNETNDLKKVGTRPAQWLGEWNNCSFMGTELDTTERKM